MKESYHQLTIYLRVYLNFIDRSYVDITTLKKEIA